MYLPLVAAVAAGMLKKQNKNTCLVSCDQTLFAHALID